MNNNGRLQNIFGANDRSGLRALHTGEQKDDLVSKFKKNKLTEEIFGTTVCVKGRGAEAIQLGLGVPTLRPYVSQPPYQSSTVPTYTVENT